MYEISFRLGQYSNPYDPDVINVYAVFTGPNNEIDTVIGFYYKGYTFQQINGYEKATEDPLNFGWRIRFTPNVLGTWSFHIHAIDQGGETIIPTAKPIPYTFTCQAVTSANGFISKANKRYLKREVVRNGQTAYQSLFPVGPNIAWYSCVDYGTWENPMGIYDYERYIDSLNGRGNYMRIWLNRYQYLNLYGPEYTQLVNGNPKVYFDSSINQKDAAELDHIITYAKQNDIALMLCFFTFGDFRYINDLETMDPSIWSNNPYNSVMGLPCQFFTDSDAKRVARNLIRYIVARWGYATNIMSWELWNEVTNMANAGCFLLGEKIKNWHYDMSSYIRRIDPFNHCISTSMSNYESYSDLYSSIFTEFDFVQRHNYQNINKAKSKEQFSYILYNLSKDAHLDYPNKPFFMGEFAFGNRKLYNNKDPYGIDLHNSLWSSLFSTSMGPSSFWWWGYLDEMGLFNRYEPLFTFCQNLPILSESFQAYTTGVVSGDQLLFPNNIETYYMKNSTEDTIYGWSQDTAFCYQSLRWLTDSVIPASQPHGLHFVDSVVFDPNGYVYTLNPQKKPKPSSNSNEIVIKLQSVPVGTQYEIHWYNSETGLEYNNSTTNTIVQQTLMGRKYIAFLFPSSIRDLTNRRINNTFGDAVFTIFLSNSGGKQEKSEKNNNFAKQH